MFILFENWSDPRLTGSAPGITDLFEMFANWGPDRAIVTTTLDAGAPLPTWVLKGLLFGGNERPNMAEESDVNVPLSAVYTAQPDANSRKAA